MKSVGSIAPHAAARRGWGRVEGIVLFGLHDRHDAIDHEQRVRLGSYARAHVIAPESFAGDVTREY